MAGAGFPTAPDVQRRNVARLGRRLGRLVRLGGLPDHDRTISSQTAPNSSAPVATDYLVLGPALATTPVHQHLDVASTLKHSSERIGEVGLCRGHDDVDLLIISVRALRISWGKDKGNRYGTHHRSTRYGPCGPDQATREGPTSCRLPALRLETQRSTVSPVCARSGVEAMLQAVLGGRIHGPLELGMTPGVCVPGLLRRRQRIPTGATRSHPHEGPL